MPFIKPLNAMVQCRCPPRRRPLLVRLETLRTGFERGLSSGAHMIKRIALSIGLALALPALACDYPDEGNMPLRRALTRVQMLPETEAWKRERLQAGDAVQFRLLLEETVVLNKRCHWIVEAVADGKVWRRFYVSPDGKHVAREKQPGAGKPDRLRMSLSHADQMDHARAARPVVFEL